MAIYSLSNYGIVNLVKYNSLLAGNIGFNTNPASQAIAGYVGGGQPFVSTVEKFAFSDDSRSTLGTGISSNRDYTSSMASTIAGYIVAGNTTGPSTAVDKFLFSNDTRSTLGTGTSIPKFAAMGFDSLVAGYNAGGTHYTNGFPTTTVVDKFLFSNDSRSTLGSGLSSARGAGPGFASTSSGYAGGGTTMDKFLFTNDSRSTLASGMSGTNGGSGFASQTAGYGTGGVSTSNVDKFLFATDARSALTIGLSRARTLPGSWGSSVAGYVSGDFSTSANSVDKFLFVNDARSTLAAVLATGRGSHAGFPGNAARTL